jgi:hypothetical protein
MSDLRAAVEALPSFQYGSMAPGHSIPIAVSRNAVLALIPEGSVLVTEETLARIEELAKTSALPGHPDWTAGSRASFALSAALIRSVS